MSMIFGDYVAGFLGLGRDGNSWSMNPFDVSLILVSSTDHFSFAIQPIKTPSGERLGRGDGADGGRTLWEFGGFRGRPAREFGGGRADGEVLE